MTGTDTSAEAVEQSLLELQDIVRCRCHPGYTGRGLRDPVCECDSAEALKVVADRIEELERLLGLAEDQRREWEHHCKTAEAERDEAVSGLTQIERVYYQEATNPSPETIRRMAARMNGIARDTQDTLAKLKGETDE